MLVLLAVAVEERDLDTVDLSDHDGIGGFAVGGVREHLFDFLEGIGVVDPGTADDRYLGHETSNILTV